MKSILTFEALGNLTWPGVEPSTFHSHLNVWTNAEEANVKAVVDKPKQTQMGEKIWFECTNRGIFKLIY